jgi:Cu(I)/Ag(I) efflux system membrane fusion protein
MGCNTKNKEDHSAHQEGEVFFTPVPWIQIKETSLVNVYLSYGLDPNQKKDNSASNEIP